MLELAINAGLPLIKVETDDTVNFPEVLETIAGTEVFPIAEHEITGLGFGGSAMGEVFYMIRPEEIDYDEVYRNCVQKDRTVIVVNPDEAHPSMFDAGVVQLPPGMLHEFLSDLVDEKDVDHLSSALGGLSMKDVGEVCRLCMAQDDSLTPQGVMSIRRMYMRGLRGVQQVDTGYGYYQPEAKVDAWLNLSGSMFRRHDIPDILVPRGLLLTGPAGTGKTMASKYIANRLEVPLFRLDLGGLMAKWVGESETNLNSALAQVDAAEPCMVLIDEVEKIFQSTDDSGVTSRLLSQLLWWLQEHTTRVLTVMTTNDIDALPKELYRPGRIDRTYTLRGVEEEDSYKFAEHLLKSLMPTLPPSKKYTRLPNSIKKSIERFWSKDDETQHMTQAEITKRVLMEIKAHIVRNKI